MAVESLTDARTSRYVQAGPVRLHFNEAGSGDAVICLHGGGPGATGWSNFNTNIGSLSKHFRTFLLDAPQYGKSDPVIINEERYTFHARVIRDMLDALKIEKVSLIGNSFGGATALAFAIEHPGRLDKLVVMGPAAGPSLFMPRPLEGIKLLSAFRDNPSRDAMRKIVEVFVYDQKFKTDELIDRRYNSAMSTPEHEEARKQSASGPQRDFTLELRSINAKSLIIWGRDDRFSPLDFALLMLWRIQNAQVHIFPECGHWAQYEKSDQFNELVLDFLLNP